MPALSFPASLNKADGAQQLTRSVKKPCRTFSCNVDDLSRECLRTLMSVTGWHIPVVRAFMCAITPDNRTTADTSTFMDDCFAKVLGAEGGTPGPEASTLFLRLLTAHFDRVDAGRRKLGSTILECVLARPFATSIWSFAC